MKYKHWTVPIVAFALLVFGCSQNKNSQNREDYSAFLYVPSGAENIRLGKFKGHDEVFYDLREDYPANRYIEDINKFLENQGFEVEKHDFMNPEIPTSYYRGWSDFEDHTQSPPLMVNQWMTDWKNDRGEYIRTRLRYTSPLGNPKNLNKLAVVVIFMPAEKAKALREWAAEFNAKKNNK